MLALPSECSLCGEKCLKLEPVMLICPARAINVSSEPCISSPRRISPVVPKCHTGLSSVLPPNSFSGDPEADWDSKAALLYKRDLLKRTYDEDIAEAGAV